MLLAHIKTLARHAAIYGSADIFGNIITIFLMPVITRYLSPSDYGALGILLLFGVLSKILFRMGLDSGFFRIYYDQKTDGERRDFTTTILVSSGAVSLTLFLITALFADRVSLFLLGAGRSLFIMLVAADTLLNVIAFIPMNLFRIRGRAARFTKVTILRIALNLTLKVVLVVRGWGVAGVLWADVISSSIFILVLLPTLLGSIGGRFSWKMLRSASSFGLPKVPHGLAYQVLNLSDRKLLDLLATRAESGLYHVAYMFGGGVKFFLAAFELAWSPFVYSLLKRADAPETFARIATYAFALLVSLGLVIATLAREILMLMTARSYHSAYPVIPVITLAYVIQGFFNLTAIGIGISRRSYYFPLMTFTAAAINVGLNLLLIPRWGMMGAAWSTVAGYAAMSGMGYFFANRHYPIPFEWHRISRITLAAGISFTVSLVAPDALLNGVLFKTACLGLFPLILLVLGFFRADEIARIRELPRVLMTKTEG